MLLPLTRATLQSIIVFIQLIINLYFVSYVNFKRPCTDTEGHKDCITLYKWTVMPLSQLKNCYSKNVT